MTGLEDFPDLVLERVIEFLDYGSRRTCRLVSRKLKDCVDDIGLSIILDSQDAVSTDLSKSVVTTEVRILHLESYDLEADAVRQWKTAILSTPVDFSWLNHHIFQYCGNLRVLILNEAAIIAEKFNGTSDPIPCLNRLSELHITQSKKGVKQGIRKLCSDFLKSGVTLDEFMNLKDKMKSLLLNNIRFLLKIINSRLLKVLCISVPGLGRINEEQGGWEYQPLYEFLQKHRNSLETIILLVEFGEPSTNLHPALTKPIQLKGIRLTAAGSLDPSNQINSVSTYWTNQLLHQGALENLSVEIHQFDEEITPFPWLAAVVANNARTLTYINLGIGFHDELNYDAFQGELDMRQFRHAEALRVFKFNGSHRMRILNLNDFPTKSLKILELSFIQIGADFDGIKFLESFSPTYFHLRGITFDEESHFKEPSYTFEFIKLVLRCRSLENFKFYATEMTTDTFPKLAVSESRLKPWLTRLEDEEHLPNLIGFGTAVWILHEKRPEWLLSYAIMNYMELVDVEHLYQAHERESPFYLPRNVDMFSVWTDAAADDKAVQKYRVLPNTKPFSMSRTDLRQIKFHLSVLLERNSTAEMKDLGLTEDTLANENGVTLLFEPESICQDSDHLINPEFEDSL